ncbi:MAG: 16S rRNA (cytosine(1402)-N(4))-methyltransferase RsmH [Acidobacteria bacterium]|nr:16S rRNA (cytosine(1402)-N(4))-methyltransferase RsmH [Acidobacteriota bacterium]
MTATPAPEPPVHLPVLRDTVVRWLAPRSGGRYLDCTFGRGGHTKAILDADPGALVLGLDKDPEAAPAAAALAAREPRFRFLEADFAEIGSALDKVGWDRVDGILIDLGLSSPQLETPGRGFALRHDGPLDMRYDPGSGETAAELLDRLDEREIADLLFGIGERRSRAIARRIAARRPLSTTGDLRAAVIAAVGPRRGRIDPATRTFLAVRSAVNREPQTLAAALHQAPARLRQGGALVVISYHSGEDRPVKHTFRRLAAQSEFELGTRRPIRPDEDEASANRRSRSACLRILRRTTATEPEPVRDEATSR